MTSYPARQTAAERWPGRAKPGDPRRCASSILPNGLPVGTLAEALDCACGLYLNDPIAWQPPTN